MQQPPRTLWRRRLEPVVSHLPNSAHRRLLTLGASVAARRVNASPSAIAAATPARPAAVDRFGRRHISGWVSDDAGNLPARITLHLNEVQVAATWAAEPGKREDAAVQEFHFELRDLWDYCARTDQVTVRLGDVPLVIRGTKVFKRPPGDGRFSLEDLRAKLDDGYVFNQHGRLQLSKKLDTAWQAAVLDLYDGVSAVVRRDFGFDPFLAYGSLLGWVREGGFIGHDVDFDAAYMSEHTDPTLAATELRDIALRLIDAGFDVDCRHTALHICDVGDPSLRIDLFHLYFDAQDVLQAPFGVVSTTTFSRSQWDGTTDGELAGRAVRVPVRARELAAHIYGPGWQVPVAGFNWARERGSFSPAARTTREFREEVYWANFYARHVIADGSTFFDAVSARDDIPAAVLDIGCGDGRDAFAFARRGSRVHGIDRSKVGTRHAAQNAADAGLTDMLSFAAVDVGQASAVRAAVATLRSASGGGPILFYARFFLHSIPMDVQRRLLQALAASSCDGDMLAVEFRTEADTATEKVHGGHYRRYQNGAAFGRSLRRRYGFGDIRVEQESAGLAPYKYEDPVVYRVIAARTGAAVHPRAQGPRVP